MVRDVSERRKGKEEGDQKEWGGSYPIFLQFLDPHLRTTWRRQGSEA